MKTASSPSVLFVTYAFPPTGGSGVQRIVKFMKFLPQHGIVPHVLTARGVLGHTSDDTMLAQLDPRSEVHRTRSLDPLVIANWMNSRRKQQIAGNATASSTRLSTLKVLYDVARKVRDYVRLPDQYVGWFPSAVIRGVKVTKRHDNVVIVASIPIYTTALIGYAVSVLTGRPLILDFRDGWADDPYVHHPTPFHRWFHRKLEGIVIRHASLVLVYGQWLADRYAEHYPGKRVEVVLNGYDPADMQGAETVERRPGMYRLVYSGTLFEYHREFITVVFEAMKRLPESLRKRIELVFVGDIELLDFNQLAQEFGLQDNIIKTGYVKHRTALGYLHSADALLFTIPNYDVSSFTGKIFEFLATRKPILGVVYEKGCAADLLRRFGQEETLVGFSVERVTSVLERLSSIQSAVRPVPESEYKAIRRDEQAAVVAALVREVASIANAPQRAS